MAFLVLSSGDCRGTFGYADKVLALLGGKLEV
jgi:hypothetical protein